MCDDDDALFWIKTKKMVFFYWSDVLFDCSGILLYSWSEKTQQFVDATTNRTTNDDVIYYEDVVITGDFFIELLNHIDLETRNDEDEDREFEIDSASLFK